MKSIGTKIRDARERLLMTQKELAEKAGLTIRSVTDYERDRARPRDSNLRIICEVLNVSRAYLMDPEIEDPEYGKDTQEYVESVRGQYGAKGARDFERLLDGSVSMMAGGDVPLEDKERFFEAITAAYLQTKKDAAARFTPKKYRED